MTWTITYYNNSVQEEILAMPAGFLGRYLRYSDRMEIYGTLGIMFLGRHGGGFQVYGPKEQLLAQDGGITPDNEHQINFIECIRSRKQPNATVEQSHLSASLVHFANIAYRTGNKQLLFDGQNEKFIDNEEANKLLKVSYRDKYTIPEKV